MSITMELAEKELERNDLISRASEALAADSRVVAAWLTGSLGRRDADAYSDVDLWIVVRDEHMEAVREGRRHFVDVLGQPVLISEAPQNVPPGGAYLLTLYPGKYGPQHVDWNWLPQSTATLPPDALVLFDHAGLPTAEVARNEPPQGDELAEAITQECAFFWAMCAVVAKYIARRKSYNVLTLMDIVAYSDSKIQWMLGEGELKTYRDSIWDPLDAPFTDPEDQIGLLRRLSSHMEFALNPRIEAAGGKVPHAAIGEVHNLFDLVRRDLESTEEQT